MPSPDERLAALEENKIHTKETIEAIFTYMKEGRAWRDDVTSTLAVVVNNQKSMTDYQNKCDKEREDLKTDIGDVKSRVTETEGFQKRQIRAVFFMGAIMTFFVEGGAKLLTKLGEWFS